MDERATRVKEILGLRRLPIKVGFLDALPPSLARWSGGPVAAGCVFWDRAMEGKSFYTLPADHWNCAVGSHTHKIALPADRGNELSATIGFMVETRYLEASEVPSIPTLDRTPAAVAYAPASSDAFKADVVLVAVTPAQSTLVFEAALKAGIAQGTAGASSRPSGWTHRRACAGASRRCRARPGIPWRRWRGGHRAPGCTRPCRARRSGLRSGPGRWRAS